MQNIENKVFIIENFIDKNTCDFIVDGIDGYAIDDPRRAGFRIGLNLNTAAALSLLDKSPLFPPSDDIEYKMATDKINNIVNKIIETISNFYKINYTLKTLNYTVMGPGTSNRIHADNKYVSESGEIKDRTSETEDRSVLLYLNDNYTGGEIYFPKLNFEIKPKPGTLIFFEGNEDTLHGVKEIQDGSRINLISFLWPVEYAGRIPDIIDGVESLEFPINTF